MNFRNSLERLPREDGGAPELLHPSTRTGRRFDNPIPVRLGGLGLILRMLPRYFAMGEERVPRHTLGPFRTDAAELATAGKGMRVTWMGHSTLLLEIDGMRVLLDPVWEERAAPFRHFGPRRFFAPPLRLDQLLPIDVVLVSHNHYDHLGARTHRQLARLPEAEGARWITSLGVGADLRRFGVTPERVTELDWTDGVRLAPSGLAEDEPGADRWLEIRAWPARHFSGRSPRDSFQTLWSSFSFRGPSSSVFFSGDSGPWEGFGPIAAAAGGFDLILLEIGAYDRLWPDVHLGPDCAIRAMQQMLERNGRPALLMPIHWGLFNLALHAWDQPIRRLVELSRALGIDLWTPVPGEPTPCLPGVAKLQPWWMKGRG